MAAAPSHRSLMVLIALVLVVSAGSRWWSARQQQQVGAQVAALARPGDIRMLSSATCSICVASRAWLTENRVPFSECVIERDAACAAEFAATGAPGTPVFLVRGAVQVGFSPARLRDSL